MNRPFVLSLFGLLSLAFCPAPSLGQLTLPGAAPAASEGAATSPKPKSAHKASSGGKASDAKPGKRKRQPVGGTDDVLLYNATLPEGATVAGRYYPSVEHRRLAFALTAIAFGVTVPDAASARAATQRGADDL